MQDLSLSLSRSLSLSLSLSSLMLMLSLPLLVLLLLLARIIPKIIVAGYVRDTAGATHRPEGNPRTLRVHGSKAMNPRQQQVKIASEATASQ